MQEQVKSSAHVGETLGTLLFVTQDKTLAVLRETLLSRQDKVMPVIYFLLLPRGCTLDCEPAVHKLPILAPFASPAPTPSTGSCYTPPLVLILQGAKSAGNTNKERILANKYICPVYSSLVTTLLSTAAHCLRKA